MRSREEKYKLSSLVSPITGTPIFDRLVGKTVEKYSQTVSVLFKFDLISMDCDGSWVLFDNLRKEIGMIEASSPKRTAQLPPLNYWAMQCSKQKMCYAFQVAQFE